MRALLKLSTFLRRIRADQAGSVAIIGAVAFPVLVGAAGLGAESGYWFLTQRKLQQITDVSAHAAGVRKKAGDGTGALRDTALYAATESGFSTTAGTLSVFSPPTSGGLAGDVKAVEVVTTRTVPRLFSSIYAAGPVTVRARAVAKINSAGACVLALSETAASAVSIGGSTDVDLSGCDVASNSRSTQGFNMVGAAGRLTAGCVYSVGGASTNSNLTLTECKTIEQNAPATPDPYANVTAPAATGTCYAGSTSNTTLTPTEDHASGVKSMRFCNGMSLQGSVTLSPGLYIIEKGDFTASTGAHISGDGVTLFFTSGASIKLNGNARLTLSAPTSGTYSGLLFFGDRNQSSVTHKLNGTADSVTQGAVYFPSSALQYTGNSATTTNGCTQVIANTVEFTGNSNLKSSCSAAGTKEIQTRLSVAVVE